MLKGVERPRGRDPRARATRGDQAVSCRGVTIRPFYNQGEVVERTTHTVFRNLIEGALLVARSCSSSSGTFRASLLTASVIPLSLLVAFLAMRGSASRPTS